MNFKNESIQYLIDKIKSSEEPETIKNDILYLLKKHCGTNKIVYDKILFKINLLLK